MYYNEEHEEKVNSRGDRYIYIGSYKCGEKTIDGKYSKSTSYIRVKCPYCGKEYDILLSSFNKGNKCTNCCHSYENSFAYHIQVELGESLNKYWDWENNTVNPYMIYKNTPKFKIYIKCTKVDYHKSHKTTPNRFFYNNGCPYCKNMIIHPRDSFGQYLIDTYGNDAIEKYWSSKNTLDPFKLSPKSSIKKVWILCQEKDYHNENGGYLVTLNNFYKGNRCSYCYNRKVHKLDSFGALYPEKVKYWSSNNDKSPYEVSPMTHKKYKFICEKCGKEFERRLSALNRNNIGVICRECSASQLEQCAKEILDKYNIKYKREYFYEDLFGIGNKNLRFDFYLTDYNLLIECQGEQHEKWQKTWQTEEDFERQLEHDRRKKEYAKEHDIDLLEIWYYDIDNIENILIEKLQIKNN